MKRTGFFSETIALQRHYVGFELNREYYDKAVARIKKAKAEPTLFDNA
jgi:DNA modification methylase